MLTPYSSEGVNAWPIGLYRFKFDTAIYRDNLVERAYKDVRVLFRRHRKPKD
jgi:hypothetical protein